MKKILSITLFILVFITLTALVKADTPYPNAPRFSLEYEIGQLIEGNELTEVTLLWHTPENNNRELPYVFTYEIIKKGPGGDDVSFVVNPGKIFGSQDLNIGSFNDPMAVVGDTYTYTLIIRDTSSRLVGKYSVNVSIPMPEPLSYVEEEPEFNRFYLSPYLEEEQLIEFYNSINNKIQNDSEEENQDAIKAEFSIELDGKVVNILLGGFESAVKKNFSEFQKYFESVLKRYELENNYTMSGNLKKYTSVIPSYNYDYDKKSDNNYSMDVFVKPFSFQYGSENTSKYLNMKASYKFKDQDDIKKDFNLYSNLQFSIVPGSNINDSIRYLKSSLYQNELCERNYSLKQIVNSEQKEIENQPYYLESQIKVYSIDSESGEEKKELAYLPINFTLFENIVFAPFAKHYLDEVSRGRGEKKYTYNSEQYYSYTQPYSYLFPEDEVSFKLKITPEMIFRAKDYDGEIGQEDFTNRVQEIGNIENYKFIVEYDKNRFDLMPHSVINSMIQAGGVAYFYEDNPDIGIVELTFDEDSFNKDTLEKHIEFVGTIKAGSADNLFTNQENILEKSSLRFNVKILHSEDNSDNSNIIFEDDTNYLLSNRIFVRLAGHSMENIFIGMMRGNNKVNSWILNTYDDGQKYYTKDHQIYKEIILAPQNLSSEYSIGINPIDAYNLSPVAVRNIKPADLRYSSGIGGYLYDINLTTEEYKNLFASVGRIDSDEKNIYPYNIYYYDFKDQEKSSPIKINTTFYHLNGNKSNFDFSANNGEIFNVTGTLFANNETYIEISAEKNGQPSKQTYKINYGLGLSLASIRFNINVFGYLFDYLSKYASIENMNFTFNEPGEIKHEEISLSPEIDEQEVQESFNKDVNDYIDIAFYESSEEYYKGISKEAEYGNIDTPTLELQKQLDEGSYIQEVKTYLSDIYSEDYLNNQDDFNDFMFLKDDEGNFLLNNEMMNSKIESEQDKISLLDNYSQQYSDDQFAKASHIIYNINQLNSDCANQIIDEDKKFITENKDYLSQINDFNFLQDTSQIPENWPTDFSSKLKKHEDKISSIEYNCQVKNIEYIKQIQDIQQGNDSAYFSSLYQTIEDFFKSLVNNQEAIDQKTAIFEELKANNFIPGFFEPFSKISHRYSYIDDGQIIEDEITDYESRPDDSISLPEDISQITYHNRPLTEQELTDLITLEDFFYHAQYPEQFSPLDAVVFDHFENLKRFFRERNQEFRAISDPRFPQLYNILDACSDNNYRLPPKPVDHFVGRFLDQEEKDKFAYARDLIIERQFKYPDIERSNEIDSIIEDIRNYFRPKEQELRQINDPHFFHLDILDALFNGRPLNMPPGQFENFTHDKDQLDSIRGMFKDAKHLIYTKQSQSLTLDQQANYDKIKEYFTLEEGMLRSLPHDIVDLNVLDAMLYNLQLPPQPFYEPIVEFFENLISFENILGKAYAQDNTESPEIYFTPINSDTNQESQIDKALVGQTVVINARNFNQSKNIQIYLDDTFLEDAKILGGGFGIKVKMPLDIKSGNYTMKVIGDAQGEYVFKDIYIEHPRNYNWIYYVLAVLFVLALGFVIYKTKNKKPQQDVVI